MKLLGVLLGLLSVAMAAEARPVRVAPSVANLGPTWGWGGYWRPYTPNAVRYGQTVQWPSDSSQQSSSSQARKVEQSRPAATPAPAPVRIREEPPRDPNRRFGESSEQEKQRLAQDRAAVPTARNWHSWDEWVKAGGASLESGSTFSTLPEARQSQNLDDLVYYTYGGYFFERAFVAGQVRYAVVSPPIGATTNTLPGGCGKMGVGGQTYHVCGNTWYLFWDGVYVVTDGPQ